MKHYLPFTLLILFFFNSESQAQDVIDPLFPWYTETANIDSAFITITPFVNYAQVDLTLNYAANNTSSFGNTDLWLEVVSQFAIPDKTIVVDSWLWIEDYVSEAYLIDLHTATEVYESYVTRTQDPSLLRYTYGHDDQLSLNIYPLPANSYRKIKISFLIPFVNETTAFSINPITDLLLQENQNVASYCEIKVNNNDTYISGSLRTALGNYSILESSTDFTTFNMNLHEIDETFAITYDKSTSDNIYAFYETTDLNYYAVETFVPFDYLNCFFADITKEMNDSSLTYNEYTNIDIYPTGFIYRESGNYFNDPPEDFVLEYVCGNQVVKDNLNMLSIESPLTDEVWAMDKIMDLTQNQSNTYSYYYGSNYEPHYTDILLTSMDYRVLTFYTAFLAIPQEDTVEASFDNNGSVISITSNTEIVLEEPKISCYPNPFKEKLTIHLELPASFKNGQVNARIIDLNGNTIHRFDPLEFHDDEELNLEWFANDQPHDISKGIYFVLLEIGGKTYTYEVLKQ